MKSHKEGAAGLALATVMATVSATVAMTGPAFAAGRCGGVLPIERQTTLAEVAKRCNVSLAALREANPGVTASAVAPGARLAMPDEIDEYARVDAAPTPVAAGPARVPPSNLDDKLADLDPFGDEAALAAISNAPAGRVRDARAAQRIRVRDRGLYGAFDDRGPIYSRAAATGPGYGLGGGSSSYQSRSAQRIHSAGVPSRPQGSPQWRRELAMAPVGNDAALSGSPVAAPTLVACETLRKEDGGKIHKVAKIISTPKDTYVALETTATGGSDCRLIDAKTYEAALGAGDGYKVPNYAAIGPQNLEPAWGPIQVALQGDVSIDPAGCARIWSADGRSWRIHMDSPAPTPTGSDIVVWGAETSAADRCGAGPAISVENLVTVERWSGD